MPDDRIIETGGFRLRVREEGRARGPAIVLVHGFAHSLEIWDAWAKSLARDHRVIRFDLPGHGLSGPDPQERYSNEDTVDALAALLGALEVRRPVIAGNSLGGLVAWRYAARAKVKPRGLILVAPGGYPMNGVSEEPVGASLMMEAFLRYAPAAGVREATRKLYGDPSRLDDARVAMVHERMSADGVGAALVKRLSQFTLPDPTTELARVTAPALIMWGRKDAVVPPDHAERFAQALKRSELKLYDDLGHTPQDEAPARTLKDARAFLRRLADSAPRRRVVRPAGAA